MDEKTAAGDTTFDINWIMDRIPHRYPFLMIDKITQLVPRTSAVGIKNVTSNEPFFQGHFPGHPIMPGVLIIEAMAQTSAVLVIESADDADDSLVYFMSIEHARFRKPVLPGDCLYLHVKKEHRRGGVWKFKGEARVDGNLMAEAIYSAMIVGKET